MKQQVDQMFDQGYLQKNPNGSITLASNEEERQQFLASNSKAIPANRSSLQAPSIIKNLDHEFDEANDEPDY
jgi:hypothetical protein